MEVTLEGSGGLRGLEIGTVVKNCSGFQVELVFRQSLAGLSAGQGFEHMKAASGCFLRP